MRIYRLRSNGSTFYVLAKSAEDFFHYMQGEPYNDTVTEITMLSDEKSVVDLRDVEIKTSPPKSRRLYQEIEGEKERMKQAGKINDFP